MAELNTKLSCRLAIVYGRVMQRGLSALPSELSKLDCLTLSRDASQTRGWAFTLGGELQHLGGRRRDRRWPPGTHAARV